jgi:hypothetical protein
MDYYIFLGRKRRINISRIQLESCRRFSSAAFPEPATPRNPNSTHKTGTSVSILLPRTRGVSRFNTRSAKAVRMGETDLERRARGQASTPAGAGRPCLLVAVAV